MSAGRLGAMRRTAMSVGLVFPVMAAIGSVLGQSVVLRLGFRPVAAAGMALMSGGALLLTQVSAPGSYFGDIFFRLLLFGPRLGLPLVTAPIAALPGPPQPEPRPPPRPNNTRLQNALAL